MFEIRAAYFDRLIFVTRSGAQTLYLFAIFSVPFRTPIRVRRGGDRGVLLGFRSLGILLGGSMNLL